MVLIDTASEQETAQEFNFNQIPCEETHSSGGNESSYRATPYILISVHYMYDVCTVLAVSRCRHAMGQVSGASLLLLTQLVSRHYRAYGQRVPADMQHLKLPSSPTQSSWRNTYIYADCLLSVCLLYIP